ncbi:hypothetical protein F5Y15DRAFT_416839 [Xylariaceae sp. FL0016]|nr:hypothetical protein F5Y15DRAFT_416839 [Xylariaceae sp. FL0016]
MPQTNQGQPQWAPSSRHQPRPQQSRDLESQQQQPAQRTSLSRWRDNAQEFFRIPQRRWERLDSAVRTALEDEWHYEMAQQIQQQQEHQDHGDPEMQGRRRRHSMVISRQEAEELWQTSLRVMEGAIEHDRREHTQQDIHRLREEQLQQQQQEQEQTASASTTPPRDSNPNVEQYRAAHEASISFEDDDLWVSDNHQGVSRVSGEEP